MCTLRCVLFFSFQFYYLKMQTFNDLLEDEIILVKQTSLLQALLCKYSQQKMSEHALLVLSDTFYIELLKCYYSSKSMCVLRAYSSKQKGSEDEIFYFNIALNGNHGLPLTSLYSNRPHIKHSSRCIHRPK